LAQHGQDAGRNRQNLIEDRCWLESVAQPLGASARDT
jgi:hypothetical protein